MISNITIIETFWIRRFIWVKGGLTKNLLLEVDLIHSVNIGNNLSNSNVTICISKGRISYFIRFKILCNNIIEIFLKYFWWMD